MWGTAGTYLWRNTTKICSFKRWKFLFGCGISISPTLSGPFVSRPSIKGCQQKVCRTILSIWKFSIWPTFYLATFPNIRTKIFSLRNAPIATLKNAGNFLLSMRECRYFLLSHCIQKYAILFMACIICASHSLEYAIFRKCK